MLKKSLAFILLTITVITFVECKQHISNEKFSSDKIYYYGIQEDISKIVDAFNSIPDDSLSADQFYSKHLFWALLCGSLTVLLYA